MNKPPRFKTHTDNSFFGDFLYDQVIPKNHFLRKAKEIIDWSKFTDRILVWYRGGGLVGRPPYDPSEMFRMLFLSYLYDISETQIEERVNLDLAFKYFVGLGVDELAPDHSSLTKFKNRLIAGAGKSAFDQLLREILHQAKELGIEFGSMQVVDSVHSIADVNTDKDRQRQDKQNKPPRDSGARWGCKGEKKKRDPETGQTVKVKDYFYGSKAHTSYNEQSKLITSVSTTAGNATDDKQFKTLVNKDEFTPIPKKRTYAGDKGYDDGENHEILKDKHLGDALKLKKTRTEKKNPNKAPWLKLEASKEYQEGLKVRYKIEQKFGEAKTGHGLRRCRYLGNKKYHLQACLTAIVLNLKVVVAEITGSTLKGYGYNRSSIRLAPT